MVAFPLIKLGYLFMRQISKPIAYSVKAAAKANPFFRNRILVPFAQAFHTLESKSKAFVMGMGFTAKGQPLSEQMAVDLGGDMLAEAVIYFIAAAALLHEYYRPFLMSSRKGKMQPKKDELSDKIAELEKRIDELSLVILREQKATGHLASASAAPQTVIASRVIQAVGSSGRRVTIERSDILHPRLQYTMPVIHCLLEVDLLGELLFWRKFKAGDIQPTVKPACLSSSPQTHIFFLAPSFSQNSVVHSTYTPDWHRLGLLALFLPFCDVAGRVVTQADSFWVHQ